MLTKVTKNSTIGIIAPAFQPVAERLEKGIQYLEKRGFKVKKGHSLHAVHGYLAGDDDLRLNDIHDMFADPEITMIICARGGWGCLRLLDRLDYDLISKNPKALVGYSDISTLQLAMWKMTNVPSLSGPMAAVEMGKGIESFTEKHFWNLVLGDDPEYAFNWSDSRTEIWQSGRAGGKLLGGCLSLMAHQLGTPYSPDYSGAILFIEDIGEEPYRIDRYLAQVKQTGIFDAINGLIIGNFIDCDVENEDKPHFQIKEVLSDYFAGKPYPVIYDFPYGHGMIKVSMPVGVDAVLDTESKSLRFKNPFTE